MLASPKHDPRNAYFQPKPVTEERAREPLRQSAPRASAAEIEARVQNLMYKIAVGPIKPDRPLSQSLEDVNDPLYGLDTHPDIIDHMWKLDKSLPQSCRWVFWGGPWYIRKRASSSPSASAPSVT
jgi:hypothetical protein